MLYSAGMVLNDVFDVEIDRLERPGRPLPAGLVSIPLARAVGFGLLAAGLVAALAAGFLFQPDQNWPFRSGAIAALLSLAIVLYNAWLKHTPLGPIGMGTCRFLNVLLGMSLLGSPKTGWTLGYEPLHLLIAGGIGVYIVGVTWFARHEAGQSRRISLVAAMSVMAAGVLMLAASSNWMPRMEIEQHLYFVLMGLLMLTVLRRTATAAANPHPENVQLAIKHSILSLIWLDAAVTAAVVPAAYALGIAALLVPALLLGRWVYST
jgi:4-hydroxybenzoate polyprenyltransferase